jgi:hypothetical protein
MGDDEKRDAKREDEKCPGKSGQGWMAKFLGKIATKLQHPPPNPPSALTLAEKSELHEIIKNFIVPPCKAACEEPRDTARSAVVFMPIGKKRFGFLAPWRCDCVGCKAMRKISRAN